MLVTVLSHGIALALGALLTAVVACVWHQPFLPTYVAGVIVYLLLDVSRVLWMRYCASCKERAL